MVQHTIKHEVGVEGKLNPDVFMEVWAREGSAWCVRKRLFDEENNFTTRSRLRSVLLEEEVTRK